MESNKTVLRYVGRGAWLPDVPARDLTDADLTERKLDVKVLVKSGLYERIEPPRIRGRLEG